jgi:hypothetical protein
MPRLIRLDRTGHTELAEWSAGDPATAGPAVAALNEELKRGFPAVRRNPGGRSLALGPMRELVPNVTMPVMTRSESSSKILLIADRRAARPSEVTGPVRRFRLARLRHPPRAGVSADPTAQLKRS